MSLWCLSFNIGIFRHTAEATGRFLFSEPLRGCQKAEDRRTSKESTSWQTEDDRRSSEGTDAEADVADAGTEASYEEVPGPEFRHVSGGVLQLGFCEDLVSIT